MLENHFRRTVMWAVLIGLNVKILVFWTVMPIAEDGGSRFL
jgi:hypothetical protein